MLVELEWRDLRGELREPGFIWRCARLPDVLFGKQVAIEPADDHRVIERYYQKEEPVLGEVCSHAYFLRDDPRPYYHVVDEREAGRRCGSFWRAEELILIDGVEAGLLATEAFDLPTLPPKERDYGRLC